jgi:hypothetical protein
VGEGEEEMATTVSGSREARGHSPVGQRHGSGSARPGRARWHGARHARVPGGGGR